MAYPLHRRPSLLEVLLLLLLVTTRAQLGETRPALDRDLIASNEFLKIFLESDDQQRDFPGSARAGEAGDSAGSRAPMPRSLDYKSRRGDNSASEGAGKPVVKLVTSGTKIVFLEEYDDDAVVDAAARGLDLQREPTPGKPPPSATQTEPQGDEVKVVAVSVSSSSQRSSGGRTRLVAPQRWPHAASSASTAPPPTSEAAGGDFINRSHKSELSIEEVEPLTMSKQRHPVPDARSTVGAAIIGEDGDSENSASTNIHNVLAAPGADAATGSANTSSSGSSDKLVPFQTVIYHDTKEGHGPQSRSISYSSISQNVEDLHAWQPHAASRSILAEAQRNVSESLTPMPGPATAAPTATAAGGAASATGTPAHTSEPAKFYSQPAKMYGVPAKFYSEPAKVYSEPAKVYGQPEKFYSEPAKVYGQPSKFYSEPSKVYSQPAKVYGEPAKSYWPLTTTVPPPVAAAATTTKADSSATAATGVGTAAGLRSNAEQPANPVQVSSRRPAIVSRIAFGEARTTTPAPAAEAPADPPQRSRQQYHYHAPSGQHHNHHHSPPQQREQGEQPQQLQSHFHQRPHSAFPSHGTTRRPLFHLDRLPYDLLNAPQPPSAAPRKSVEHADFATGAADQRPCPQSGASQRRQHLSAADRHSNQNAKGLPNGPVGGDLVKCATPAEGADAAAAVASAAAPPFLSRAHFTTERSRADELPFTPTPEQNYEIEESVSVMSNGRAHGVQGAHTDASGSGGSARAGLYAQATTTTGSPVHRQPATRTRIRFGVAGPSVYGVDGDSNANANVSLGQAGGGGGSSDAAYDGSNNNSDSNDAGYQHYDDPDEADIAEDGGDDQQQHSQFGTKINSSGGRNSNDRGEDGDDAKVAYVVEGRNYRKYRVEEKTDDGFIVGEYGVVDHNDGNLRGVRYTADSTINRSLIQKALLTFLKLK